MASQAVEDRLDRLSNLLRGLGKTSHKHPADYGKAVGAFIELVDQGEAVQPDEVQEWALGRGWDEADARDLAELADAVVHTMRALRNQGRL